MTVRKVTKAMILSLALISAVTATGLLAGYKMQAWICMYWITLTAKNFIDYAAAGQGKAPGAGNRLPRRSAPRNDMRGTGKDRRKGDGGNER